MFKEIVTASALMVAVSTAQAATMKAVVTGTIYSGYDQTGVYGAAETSLIGSTITLTFIYDPDLAGFRTTIANYDSAYGGTGYGVASPSLSTTVRIGSASSVIDGGNTDVFQVCDISYCGNDSWYGQAYEYDYDSVAGTLRNDYATAQVFDSLIDFLTGDLETPFDVSFGSDFEYYYGYFQNFYYEDFGATYNDYAYGSFTVERLTVTKVDTAIIPLPASGLLLLAALGGIVGLRRRWLK